MFRLKKRVIFVPIVLILMIILAMYLFYTPDIVGWNDFKRDMKVEYTNIKSIGVKNITNTLIKIEVHLKNPFEIEDVEGMFLKTIDFLNNEESYNSLQNNHKEKYKYSAGNIKIVFKYVKKNASVQCDYESTTETEGNDFTFDSFRKWRINYQGDYLGVYELPQK